MSSLAKQHGDQWEAYVRQECREIARRGEGQIGKNWEAPKVRGSHASREQSKPDFSGCLPGGRHIVFECKATLNCSRFDCTPDRLITKGQLEHLRVAHELGAVSFVYVLDGENRKWVVPYEVLVPPSVALEEVGTQKDTDELFTDTLKRMSADITWRRI